MSDVWSERAEAYRTSVVHATGDDLDLVVDWCEPAEGVTVLDVATGGGHVARRLRERGATVVTVDPAPGMQADTTAAAEDLPFADASFDLVYTNGVIHHTPNTRTMVEEIRRVLRPGGRVIAMVYAENSLHYWRNLVFYVGMKQRRLDHASMGDIMSRSVEVTGNDARPLVKVYTRQRLRRLFHRFDHVSIVQRQIQRAELPRVLRPLQFAVERVAGWNLIVKASKPR